MALWNFTERLIRCELVYWGPPGAGKTASLRAAAHRLGRGPAGREPGRLRRSDPDHLELRPGAIEGATAALVARAAHATSRPQRELDALLLRADAVVFVADSRRPRLDENMRSLARLERRLDRLGRNREVIPVLFQWNKRDLPNAVALEELQGTLNPQGAPAFPTVATREEGVVSALRRAGAIALERAARDLGLVGAQGPTRPPAPAEPAAEAATPEAPPREASAEPAAASGAAVTRTESGRILVGIRPNRPSPLTRLARALVGRA